MTTMKVQKPPMRRKRQPIILGAIAAFVVSACVLTLIATPFIFRGLSGEWQDRLVRRFPFMSVFEPTRAFTSDVLPTLAATHSNALALLSTETPAPNVPVPTATPTVQPPTVVASPSQAPMSPTTVPASATLIPSPTLVPSNIPATNTPVPPTRTLVPTATDQPSSLATKPGVTQVAVKATDTQAASPTSLPPTAAPTLTSTALPSATTAPTLTLTPSAIPPSPTLVVPPTLIPSPTLVPSATLVPVPDKVHLSGLQWVPQTWNNCGPANLTQVLNYYKMNTTQDVPAAYLKPNKDDKNVSPWQILDYVNKYVTPKNGLKAIARVGGDVNTVKRFIAAKIPIITETGFIDLEKPKGDQWIGHYQTVIAYDDAQSQFLVLDTYKNERTETYTEFYDLWEDFNRLYIIVYPGNREADVMSILGPDADEIYNIQHSLGTIQKGLAQNPNDAFGWFALGENYTLLKHYQEAATAFDQAFSMGVLPYRMIWYQFGPFEAYYNIGHFDQVMQLVNVNLGTTLDVEETFYWRGMVHAAQGETGQAIDSFTQAIVFNPNFYPAKDALAQVKSGTFKPPAAASG